MLLLNSPETTTCIPLGYYIQNLIVSLLHVKPYGDTSIKMHIFKAVQVHVVLEAFETATFLAVFSFKQNLAMCNKRLLMMDTLSLIYHNLFGDCFIFGSIKYHYLVRSWYTSMKMYQVVCGCSRLQV